MSEPLVCPICTMTDILDATDNHECATCGHEWPKTEAADVEGDEGDDELVVKDANGNVLQEGDAVIVLKDLKVKGSSMTIKAGTKVKGIRLVDGDHDIDCKVNGMGVMLTGSKVKKA